MRTSASVTASTLDPQLLDIPQAATLLGGITTRTVMTFIARGDLRVVRLPGLRRVFLHRADVEKFIAEARERSRRPAIPPSAPAEVGVRTSPAGQLRRRGKRVPTPADGA